GGTTLFTLTDSPASVSLNQTGQQYFICTVGGHCSSGQKLAINVTRKASTTSPAPQPGVSPSPRRTSPVAAPAPQPATPPPTPAPAPASSTGSLPYTVGDTIGWTVPNAGAATYVTWASAKTFKVG
ncbi:hypothetical protein EI013_27420, partial [Escherichia coli]|nr:hypothetical protein [Escherichia coli]